MMAEFKRFDPERWEPEQGPESEGEGVAKVAKAAKVEPSLATLAGLAALPGTISAGVASLDEARCPIKAKASHWVAAVRDAKRIAEEGWAAQTLALGWSAVDLFGAVTDPAGDPEADGLAVRLNGRKLLALCGSFATVANEPRGRAFIYRRTNEAARLLWALGRGR